MEGNLKKPEQRRDLLEIASGFKKSLHKQRPPERFRWRCFIWFEYVTIINKDTPSWIKSLKSQTADLGEWIDDFLRNSGHLNGPSEPLFKF
ncbi:hypothetical protein BS614_25560 [Paenibacillus xylanexedens]|nr:hypothetical protein BS614_25560 [Paenibacillus xylanexedens]